METSSVTAGPSPAQKLLRSCFSFRGRSPRLAYFLGGILDLLIALPAMFLAIVVLPETPALLVCLVILVLALCSSICVAVRRFHDLDRSGMHWFLLLIPLVNIYYGVQLLVVRGTDGPNRYGANPRIDRSTAPAAVPVPIENTDVAWNCPRCSHASSQPVPRCPSCGYLVA